MLAGTRRLLRAGHRALAGGKLEAAVEAFEKAAGAAPGDRRGFVQLALARLRRGDGAAVRPLVASLLARFPDDPVVEFFAGRCLVECEDTTAAEPLLRAAADKQPENDLARQYLALCELMEGRLLAAAPRLERTHFAANADFLALLSYEVERRVAPTPPVADQEAPAAPPERAAEIGELEQRAAASPSTLRGRMRRRRIVRRLLRLAERAYDRGEFAEALAGFEAARRCEAQSALALLGIGLSSLHLERPNAAAQALAEALALSPDDPVAGSSCGDALYRAGRFEEALAVFEQVEPAGPEDFHAHYGRGAALSALGRKQAALEQFRIAFERYRLDSVDDCLIPAWQELLRREMRKPSGDAA